jgi:hypothetical protein
MLGEDETYAPSRSKGFSLWLVVTWHARRQQKRHGFVYKRVTRIAGPMNQPTRDGLKSATDIFGVLVLNIAVAK